MKIIIHYWPFPVLILSLVLPFWVENESGCRFCTILNAFKEFSIPLWILIFSISWLSRKLYIKTHVHLQESAPSRIKTLRENAHTIEDSAEISYLENRLQKVQANERELTTIEIAISIAGIIVGFQALIHYFLC